MRTRAAPAFVLAVSACLGGCSAHTHRLVLANDAAITVGSFEHAGLGESHLSVTFGGIRFTASGFAVRKRRDRDELEALAGANARHRQRILAGLDTEHDIYAADVILRSPDGAATWCSLIWVSRGVPAGICIDAEGTEVEIRAAPADR